jgi:hypothetical protein
MVGDKYNIRVGGRGMLALPINYSYLAGIEYGTTRP